MARTLSCCSTLILLAIAVPIITAKPTTADENSEYDVHGAQTHEQANLGDRGVGRLLLREALLRVPQRQVRAGLDSLSGISFGTSKRFDSLSGTSFGTQKRNFDEIDRSAFDSFIKRNFDEIDRSAFDSFIKRNFDEIDRVGFNSFFKRRNEPLLPPAAARNVP